MITVANKTYFELITVSNSKVIHRKKICTYTKLLYDPSYVMVVESGKIKSKSTNSEDGLGEVLNQIIEVLLQWRLQYNQEVYCHYDRMDIKLRRLQRATHVMRLVNCGILNRKYGRQKTVQ